MHTHTKSRYLQLIALTILTSGCLIIAADKKAADASKSEEKLAQWPYDYYAELEKKQPPAEKIARIRRATAFNTDLGNAAWKIKVKPQLKRSPSSDNLFAAYVMDNGDRVYDVPLKHLCRVSQTDNHLKYLTLEELIAFRAKIHAISFTPAGEGEQLKARSLLRIEEEIRKIS